MHDTIKHDTHDAFDRLRASLPEGQRSIVSIMEKVRGEYLPSAYDEDLCRGFDTLLRSVATRHLDGSSEPTSAGRRETRAMVVVGEPGTGKTESLRRLFQQHASTPGYGVAGSGCPLVSVSLPNPCTLKVLGFSILKALGYPIDRDLREHLVWKRVVDHLPTAGVLVIHLDELHNLTDRANVDEIDKIRKTLKALMVSHEWLVGLVISGVPSIVPDLREIDEIRRRGRFVRVPLVEVEDGHENVGKQIVALARIAGIDVDEGLANQIGPRLAHAALFRFGILTELIHEAIETSLADGVPFDMEAFATAYFDRTGVGDLLNPFVAANWHEIDCTLVLRDEAPPEPVLPEDPPSKKRGKGGKKGKGAR